MSDTHADRLFARLSEAGDGDAVVWQGRTWSYRQLLSLTHGWEQRLTEAGIGTGDVCAFVGDYSPNAIALFLALLRRSAIAVPVSILADSDLDVICRISGAGWLVRFANDDEAALSRLPERKPAPLLEEYRASGHPGLIVFTSGSSGRPKAILHDLDRVLAKFERRRTAYRTLMCLMFDHFGGINTLLACLSYGGAAICLPHRTPEEVCATTEGARAGLLPTTPTFLRMILASGAWKTHDMSSLKMISYGAEPMPASTLSWLSKSFPHATLKQTYGLSELGVLHSKSAESESLWLKVGGAGFETKVVDGVLHIRSESSMIGYLNAPSPFDEDGWMCTNDLVEEKDGYIRFLGRTSEVINVGGQKVFPAEVENALMQADNVVEATVGAEPHPLLGQAVTARVSLSVPEDADVARSRLRRHCLSNLAKFKVPMRFQFVSLAEQTSVRAKKQRSTITVAGAPETDSA